MKKKIKLLVFSLLALTFVLLLSGCGENATPYETNNSEGYTVSVKFDANGGIFTTNTSVIVDSFNTEGKSKVALISPDDSRRDNDAFTASKNGHFLAGWYKERIETTDSDGNTVYTYAEKWDFENDILKIDENKEYSAEEPALTLYAAWVPLFEIEFYSLDSGELIDTMQFDPTDEKELSVPAWNEETGAVEMFDFPERDGYTYNKAYFDAAGTNELTGETLTHPGIVNVENATATDSVLKLYVDWTEGEWYRIYNVDQFIESASLNGNYELFADLDFTDEIWPTTFMYGNFGGVIKGNGHSIKNVEAIQTNNSKVNAGLFGHLTDTANISDISFENITFTIKAGTRKVGTNYGLFAGTLSSKATLSNVRILKSHLQIDSSCYFGADDY
ncbi:MAG: hypothetical protein IJZ21_05675, partial [Clostridia bacterium]|nr:hypothetical protein [Clostridia bacterium]